MHDAIIIGGGVVGCSIARELSRYHVKLALLERSEDVCTGTSKANSAIVHAGFDAAPGTLKARFNVEGSQKMEALCQTLDIPYRRCGALVVSFDAADRPRLEELMERGHKNGVEGLEILEGEELHRREPALDKNIPAALYAATSAIVCPFELTAAMAENAQHNGAEFYFDTCVEQVERSANGTFTLHTNRGEFESRIVISAAGVYGDVIHNQLCADQRHIIPRRGEYCLLDRKDGALVNHTVFQLPGPMGKGVLVTPTVHGNLLLGPTAIDQEDKDAKATTAEGTGYLLATAERSVPHLPTRDMITGFAGLRAHLADGADDFVVGESAEGFFEALGIESPGLTAAPAIGTYLAELAAKHLGAEEKADFDGTRKAIVCVRSLPFAERKALIEENPAYGQIICRCEQISEGEIIDAIHRGARSLDGVKRRCRAGMGRCQGGFCAPRVMEILSRELGVPQTELTKSGGGSRLLTGHTKEVQA